MSQADALTKRQKPSGREELRQEIESRIRRLERASGHGLWGMVIFLLVSLAAFNNFAILPDLPDHIRRTLGTPPPVEMISLALVVYAFSGIVYTLARMTRDIQSYRGLMHAGFLVAFYGFYHLSGYLTDNFWAVFFAGLSVMGLENYYLWQQSSAAIRKEKAQLSKLEKGLPLYAEDDEAENEV
jgi:hypothetical protein